MHTRTQAPPINFTRLAAEFLRSGVKYAPHYLVLTPTLAQDLLERGRYDQQRPLSQVKVATFLEYIAKDQFLENTHIDVCITPDGQMYLVDGQHRLTAITRQSQTFPVLVQLCRMENRDAIQVRYDKHDAVGGGRTLNDKLGKTGAELGISRLDAGRLSTAVNHIRFGFLDVRCDNIAKRVSKKDGGEVRALMREWATVSPTAYMDPFRDRLNGAILGSL